MSLRLNICNINNQKRLFDDGYKIVYRKVEDSGNTYSEDSYNQDEEYKWKRLESNIMTSVKFNLN